MGGRLVRFLAWKALLYLVVAVVLAGVTRDLTLTALLTLGFAAGDSAVAAVLRTPTRRGRDQETEGPRPSPVTEPDHSSTP